MRYERTAVAEASVGRLLVYAGPLLWAILILFHPIPGEGSSYDGIRDQVDRWLVVHVGQLILTPFLFLAVWRLLDGLPSPAALASRCGLVVWTVFFSAYDSIQGVATGVLASHANGLGEGERGGFAASIEYLVTESSLVGDVSVFSAIAGAAWLTVAIGAAIALYRAGAGIAVVAAAVVSTAFSLHVAPAAIGLLALVVAGVLWERQGAGRGDEPPTFSPPADAPRWGTGVMSGGSTRS